jgi:hypothetical protein
MKYALFMNWLAFLAMAALVTWFRYSIAQEERRLERDEALASFTRAEAH